jgi:hypothetical protein
MKMQFSKNKFSRNSEPIKHSSIINETQIVPMKPLLSSSQYRKYDMISIANSGSKCNFCNR